METQTDSSVFSIMFIQLMIC